MIPGCGIDFERATEKPQSMSLTQSARAGIRDALGVVTVSYTHLTLPTKLEV